MPGQEWWGTCRILALGRLKQEDCQEFKASLGYIVKPCFKKILI
jgi:hypothetical protein